MAEIPEGYAPVLVNEDGFLFAPAAPGVDPIEAVLSFLDSVDPDTLEQNVLTDHRDLPVAQGFLEALREWARDAAG